MLFVPVELSLAIRDIANETPDTRNACGRPDKEQTADTTDQPISHPTQAEAIAPAAKGNSSGAAEKLDDQPYATGESRYRR